MDANSGCRLLVVDDDQTILRLFSTALVREGFEVATAATGREGLRLATETQVDVALLDINLPDISGIEVMRQIVKTTSTIVILITGDVSHHSHESAVHEGAADFIVKPVRLSELAMRIRQAQEMRALVKAKERLIAELERLVVRDELTGLYNYRHFQGQLRAEVERARRYQRSLSLVVVDVDRFKDINDTLGHAEGDRVLGGIAQIITAKVRATDTTFRYGGDEFAVLLPETLADQAQAVAERIRQGIGDADLVASRGVTVSAGVAELHPTEDADGLLQRADSALYSAKRAGRNCVVVA
jgi:two-component system cell cycle response regulator